MSIFKGQNLLKFSDRFKSDLDCKEYLAEIKSKTAYKCSRCNHTACQSLKDFGRKCNICSHIESATAATLFHKVKFGVRKAFSFVLRCQLQPRVYLLVIWQYAMESPKLQPDFLCIK